MNRLPFIILLIMLLSAACGHDSRLDTAAALMYPAPDSAMALLDSIDPASLHGKHEHARYALLYSQAQNKNHIFPTSDSLINIAVSYYDHSGHDSLRMLAHFYRSVIYNSASAHHSALRDALLAKDLAESLHQPYWVARASQEIADAYYQSYDMTSAIQYLDYAIKNFNATGYLINSMYVNVDKANALGYSSRCEESIKLLDSLSGIVDTSDYNLASYIEDAYIRPCFYSNQISEALKHGNKAKEMVESHGEYYTNYSDLAEVHIKLGNLDSALYYIDQADKYANSNLHLTKSRYYKEIGNYKESLFELEKRMSEINDRYSALINNNISNEENDFVLKKREAESLAAKQNHTTTVVILFFLIVAVLLLLLYLRHTTRMNRLRIEQRLNDATNMVEELTSRNHSITKELTDANLRLYHDKSDADVHKQIIESLFKNQFKSISNICDKYYDSITKHNSTSSVSKKLEEQFEYIISADSVKNMQEIINHYSNGKLNKLTEQVTLKSDELTFLTLLIAGFSQRSICALMKIEYSTFYTKRRRLKEKLEVVDSPIISDFLRYLAKRKS